MSARYDRALDSEVESVLSVGGELRFLIDDVPSLSKDPFALDIQIREDNKLMYYHGTTRLLTLTFRMKAKDSTMVIVANAAGAYGKYPACSQQYADLMKSWLLSDISGFKKAWQAYLKAALLGAKGGYFGNQKEGYWQNRLCIEFGTHWTPNCEWLVIDRECVIGFGQKCEKDAYYEAARKKSMDIKELLQKSAPAKWGKQDKKGFGDEVDMLAIDRDGKLVVIELKHGSNARGIYWGPLQVEVYYRAFKVARSGVIEGIRKLVNQKINLGLLPKEAKQRAAEASLLLGEAVLAIAAPNKKSACWDKMLEVCEKTKQTEVLPLKIALLQAKNNAIELHSCEAEERTLRSRLEV